MAPEGYTTETIDLPDVPEMEIGGVETREDGTVVASTRGGAMWEYDPDADEWSNLSNSLHTALGVWIDDETDDIFTAQMPRLSRLVDETGDGTIDAFETLTQEWGFSGNYHEFAYGPVRDSEGNFYVTLNLGHGGGGTVKQAIMGHSAPYRGWAIKVTPDGEFVPYASGLRSPAGIGINADDEVFFTDNEGDYMPTNHLSHLREGEYYGHAAALHSHPDFEGEDLNAISDEEYDALRTDHAVWIPYSESNSTTGVAFAEAGGFGPFEGQVFLGEQTQSKVLRASLEKVDGHYQGAVFNFADGFQSGVVDIGFSPDGQDLWVGQTNRGWGSVGSDPFGLQRLGYDGETVPFEMKTVSILPSGFEIEFTEPVDEAAAADPSNYAVSHWTYDNSSSYGSPRLDNVDLDSSEIAVEVHDSGERVVLELPEIYITPEGEDGLVGGTRVYELTLNGIGSAEGDSLANNQAWYTVNHLPADVSLTATTEQLDEETVAVTGRLETPREPLTDGELSLTTDEEGVDIAAETALMFEEISGGDAFEAEWTVTVPETGAYDFELHATYVEDGEVMELSTPVSRRVFPFPESIEPNQIGVGAEPSSDATILWDGEDNTLDGWEHQDGSPAEWQEFDDYFQVNNGTGDIKSGAEFGDCHLHVEWRAPEDVTGSGQGRSNSGVFMMDRYEFQVLDNYDNPTFADGWHGSYYAQAPPLVSPMRPPGEWQSYDIIWRAPRFDDSELERPAQATVLVNGVVVLAHLDVEGPNVGGFINPYEAHPMEEPVRLQDHTDEPHFRNIWYRPLREDEFEQAYAPLEPDYDFSLYETTAGTDDVGYVDPGGPGARGEPPADAEPLLEDGLEGWGAVNGGDPGWNETDDYVEAVPGAGDIQTEAEFSDAQIHLEWRIPEDVEGEGTDRGNSGTLMLGQYQIQLLDVYGNPVDPVQWAGAYPDQAPPQVSPVKPPGEWQHLDIFWQGPRFNGFELTRPARVTALLNETVVQARLIPDGPNPDDTVEEYQPHSPTGPLRLQEHGSPVQFRNIWTRDLDPDYEPTDPDPPDEVQEKVAYYPLDADTPTNEVTGQDAEVIGNPTPGVEGVYNDAWEFTISDDRSTTTDALVSGEDLQLNGAEVTVAAWVQYTDKEDFGRIYQVGADLSSGTSGQPGWEVTFVGDSDEIRIWTTGGDTDTRVTLSPDTWYFVVAVVDGNDVRLHAFDEDGELDESPDIGNATRDQSSSEPLILMSGDDSETAGKLDEVHGFSYALTESEVETLWETNSLEGEPISAPYAIDCGGEMTDETVTIDGLEFEPSPEVSQGIDIGLGDNRTLTTDEAWWPDAVDITPNPNVYGQDVDEVANTEHDTLYKTEYWADGELAFDFHIENGVYDLVLHFSEIGGDNERIFDVSVQGEPAIELDDTLAEVAGGTDTAYVVTLEGVEVTDELLTIEAVSSQENPKFSAIEIRESEEELPDEFLSIPYGMDCGGAHTDETVTIDGLEFDPSPEVSQAIEMNMENRTLTQDEIWWPDSVVPSPNPNSNAETYNDEWDPFPEIDGTDHDSLYQTEHWANNELSYTFHVENGVYDVTLHFAEIVQTSEEARVFSASINGESVVEDLDLYDEHGPTTAATYTVEEVAVEDNQLVVDIESSVENPKISGIGIRETPVETISVPFAMDCGGETTDDTVEIDGLEFGPTPEQSGAIDIGPNDNREIDDDEFWWPEGLQVNPNPWANGGGYGEEIDGTEHDLLYQSEHWADGELSYTFHVEDGTYDVTLHFAEYVQNAPGNRVFDVLVQGETVLEDLDIYDEVGPNTALVETIEGVEVTDGQLTVTGDSSIENPKFSGIEIREADGDGEDEPVEAFEFDGQTGGWIGIAPETIEGEENPTLTLQEGETYQIGWTQGDGSSHNIAVWNEDEEVVDGLSTDRTGNPGDEQWLTFTATAEMAYYVCEPHEGTMIGELNVE